MLKSEAIKTFLKKKTHPDLADLYSIEMECQVNVARDGGDLVVGEYRGHQWRAWTDGQQTWKMIRIPHNAATNPEYTDSEIQFSLADHAEGIGMTGWDWQARVSRWVAYDFDAITGHSDKHQRKLSDDELAEIANLVRDIPWVTLRKSTSGRGLHLYVFLEPRIATANHNEHAALARAILGKLSSLVGFDFGGKVDACGGNMWVWHRKMAENPEGLALVKSGVPLDDVPVNWRDHVKVITGHRRKNLPRFISDVDDSTNDIERMFLELTGQNVRVPLDEEHKKLIRWLEEKKTQSWWDPDHHMLVTHTFHLKEAHQDLGLRGIFETLAKGTEAGADHNCFAFPLRRGGWVVRRYSMGVAEANTWEQDGVGWTRCYFNMEPDLATASKAAGGIEHPSGGFIFTELESAVEAARRVGAHVPEITGILRAAPAKLKPHKDGRLIIEIEDKDRKGGTLDGWLYDRGTWKRIFNIQVNNPAESEVNNYDELVRHLVTESGQDYGWVIRGDNDVWREEPLKHIQLSLESMGLTPKEVKSILGSGVIRCWQVVNYPFQPEYPGNRKWNRNAPQLRFAPNQSEDLKYPTWTKILEHCGRNLNDDLANNGWAKANGILTGADYLKLWIASLFREPREPLPYLFFYGNQNCGKSIFHEALSLLITRGYVLANTAITNPSAFNGELENAVLCVVEEIDLRNNKFAYNRIKDWVTARQISIHSKGKTPFQIPNATHWIQVANSIGFCPVFPGDTRITMIRVDDLDVVDLVPKKTLMARLESEAPDFLAEILKLDIPASNDRLNVPVISTSDKIESEKVNRTLLEEFIEEQCFYAPGEMVRLSDFYDRFINYIPTEAIPDWGRKRVGHEMPARFPKGRSRKDGQWHYGNISFTKPTGAPKPKLKAVTDAKSQVFLDPES